MSTNTRLELEKLDGLGHIRLLQHTPGRNRGGATGPGGTAPGGMAGRGARGPGGGLPTLTGRAQAVVVAAVFSFTFQSKGFTLPPAHRPVPANPDGGGGLRTP